MSDSNVPYAPQTRVDERQLLADEFFRVTGAQLIPFVSDEASWYDFDYLDDTEVTSIIHAHYGVAVDDTVLSLPFWKLLDLLAEARGSADMPPGTCCE